MTPSTPKIADPEPGRGEVLEPHPQTDKPRWETPRMEDVSEQVMAQPYIRFT